MFVSVYGIMALCLFFFVKQKPAYEMRMSDWSSDVCSSDLQALLRRAIAMEPGYARAHALLGWAAWWATLHLWAEERASAYRQAAGHAQNALALDPSDPWARMVSGLGPSTAGQHERALGERRTVLALNPSFTLGHMAYGWALLRAGQCDEAIVETGRALRMSPVDNFSGFYTSVHGLALLAARRFGEALPFLRASVAAFPDYSGHYNSLISCCGHLGLMEEAQEFAAVRSRMNPPLSLGLVRRHLAKFAHCDVFVEGLRRAGVPEESVRSAGEVAARHLTSIESRDTLASGRNKLILKECFLSLKSADEAAVGRACVPR